MKRKAPYILLFATLITAISLYGNYGVNIIGDVSVLRNGSTSSISDISSIEKKDIITVAQNSALEIKINNIYYYIPQNTSVKISENVELLSGVLYESKSKFDSLTEFLEYDKMLNIYASPYPFNTGEVASVYISHKNKLEISKTSLTADGYPIMQFYKLDEPKDENVYRSVFGLHIGWQFKSLPFKAQIKMKKGIKASVLIDMEVNTKPLPERPKQIKGVNKKMTTILGNKAKSKAERELLHGTVYTKYTPKDYIKSEYLMPAVGRYSSDYGAFRGYTANYARFHEGFDIANTTGSPIYAANDGIVRISQELFVRGNCVVIDHGQGVYSSYFHMSKLIAEEGDVVKKGELIGLIGTTGMSTGPHLHWEMRAGNVTYTPLSMLERTFNFDKATLILLR